MTCTFGRCADPAIVILEPRGAALPRCHWHMLMSTGGVRHIGVYRDYMVLGKVLLSRGTTVEGRRELPSRHNVAAGAWCNVLWLTTRVLA